MSARRGDGCGDQLVRAARRVDGDTAQSFPAEIAVVAGLCSASRVLASWRAPVATSRDRAFVRSAAMISASALAIAAAGWSTALAIASHRLTNPNNAPLLIGGAVMCGAAILAVAVTGLLQFNPGDNTTEPGSSSHGSPLRLGEQSVRLVQRHPVISCGIVTIAGPRRPTPGR